MVKMDPSVEICPKYLIYNIQADGTCGEIYIRMIYFIHETNAENVASYKMTKLSRSRDWEKCYLGDLKGYLSGSSTLILQTPVS